MKSLVVTRRTNSLTTHHYVAQALGAEVTETLTDRTTHVVAERTNTEKVVEGSRRPGVLIVNKVSVASG